jgi:hypothetical protein
MMALPTYGGFEPAPLVSPDFATSRTPDVFRSDKAQTAAVFRGPKCVLTRWPTLASDHIAFLGGADECQCFGGRVTTW